MNIDYTGIFIKLIFAVVIGFLIYIAFLFVDSIGTSGENYYVYVIDKHHTPGHMQTTTIYVNNSPIINNIWIPPSWSVKTNSEKTGNVSCGVSHGKYEHLKIGDKIIAVISKGRFTDDFYCKDII